MKITQKGSLHNIPPRIIGEGFKLYRMSLGQIAAGVLGVLAALFYLVAVPFPEAFNIKLIVAVGIVLADGAYFFLPFVGGLTGFEWTLTFLSYQFSAIPRRTRARPAPMSYTRSRLHVNGSLTGGGGTGSRVAGTNLSNSTTNTTPTTGQAVKGNTDNQEYK